MSMLDRDHYPDNWLDQVAELKRRTAELERPVAGSWARATQSDAQSIPNNVATKVEYDEEHFDERGEYDAAINYRFTAQVAGYYLVQAAIMFTATAAFGGAEYAALYLYKDAALESVLDRKDQLDVHAGNTNVQLSGGDLVWLPAGEYVEIYAFQNSGGALALHNDSDYNYLAICRIF